MSTRGSGSRRATCAFGSTFYGLTGLHGLHVFVGLNLLLYALHPRGAGPFRPRCPRPPRRRAAGDLLALRRRHVDRRLRDRLRDLEAWACGTRFGPKRRPSASSSSPRRASWRSRSRSLRGSLGRDRGLPRARARDRGRDLHSLRPEGPRTCGLGADCARRPPAHPRDRGRSAVPEALREEVVRRTRASRLLRLWSWCRAGPRRPLRHGGRGDAHRRVAARGRAGCGDRAGHRRLPGGRSATRTRCTRSATRSARSEPTRSSSAARLRA